VCPLGLFELEDVLNDLAHSVSFPRNHYVTPRPLPQYLAGSGGLCEVSRDAKCCYPGVWQQFASLELRASPADRGIRVEPSGGTQWSQRADRLAQHRPQLGRFGATGVA